MVLGSCGGGGGAGPSGTPPIAAPPPSPPVVTAPPPPPSPSYDPVTSFPTARSFSDFGVRLETLQTGSQVTTVSSALQPNLGEVGFNYSPNPRGYSVFYERESESFLQLSPVTGDFSGESFNGFTDSPTNTRISSFVRANRNTLSYVGQVRWGNSITSFSNGNQRTDRVIERLFTFGPTTLPTDLPTSGTDLFKFVFTVTNPLRSVQATTDLSINWQTGQMTGNGQISCAVGQPCPQPNADIQIVAQFDGNGRFQGTIGGPAGYRGTIVGRFYGPRAIEVGGVMRMAGGGIDEAIGSFTAAASSPRASR